MRMLILLAGLLLAACTPLAPGQADEPRPTQPPAGTAAAPANPTRPATPAAFGSSVTYFVAPNGSDAWSGTLPAPNAANGDGPFASLDHARAQVQALDKRGLTQITVQVRAGTYYLPATVVFTAADSGSTGTPIAYENYPGEAPMLSGGTRVQNWTNVGGNRWQTTLPASTRYFENLYVNDVRRLRPRLGGYLGAYLRFAGPVYLKTPGPPAAAPNPNCANYVAGEGWECFDRFRYNPADAIAGTWRNLAPPPGNPCGQPAGNAALAGDIEVLDFEKYAAPKLRISCVDTHNHIVYLTGPTEMNPNTASAEGFIAMHNLFYFDRSESSTPAFYVQGGCSYGGGFPYTEFQRWDSNLYWRTDGRFAGDAKAFHVQPDAAPNNSCSFANTAKWTFFTLAGWQKMGEDAQSVVRNPGFANAAYPADDYSLPKGSPGVGFVVFDPNQAGRTNSALNLPVVPATFPTKTYNSATDF